MANIFPQDLNNTQNRLKLQYMKTKNENCDDFIYFEKNEDLNI